MNSWRTENKSIRTAMQQIYSDVVLLFLVVDLHLQGRIFGDCGEGSNALLLLAKQLAVKEKCGKRGIGRIGFSFKASWFVHWNIRK